MWCFYCGRETIIRYADLKQRCSNSCQVSLLCDLFLIDTDKTQNQISTFVVIEDTSGHGVLINTGFFPQPKGLFPLSFVLGHFLGYLFSKHWFVDKDSLFREVSTLIKNCKTKVCTGGLAFSGFRFEVGYCGSHLYPQLSGGSCWMTAPNSSHHLQEKTRESSLSVCRVCSCGDQQRCFHCSYSSYKTNK